MAKKQPLPRHSQNNLAQQKVEWWIRRLKREVPFIPYRKIKMNIWVMLHKDIKHIISESQWKYHCLIFVEILAEAAVDFARKYNGACKDDG